MALVLCVKQAISHQLSAVRFQHSVFCVQHSDISRWLGGEIVRCAEAGPTLNLKYVAISWAKRVVVAAGFGDDTVFVWDAATREHFAKLNFIE